MSSSGARRVLSVGTMRGVDLEDYLRAAQGAGFDAVSLRPRGIDDWTDAAPGRSPSTLRAVLDEHGLTLAEVDPVLGWEMPATTGIASASEQERRRVLDIAAVLGARAVTALVGPEADWDEAAATDGFGRLCEQAAARGLSVQLEFFAWSPLRELRVARRVVRAAGAANGGLLIDTWHLARGGGNVEDVDATGIGEVLALQVADGPVNPIVGDLATECRDHRLWPGEGALHPEAAFASLSARGWQGPVGVEVFGDGASDPLGRARRAYRSLGALGYR